MSSVGGVDSSVTQDGLSGLGSECRNTRVKRAVRISSLVAHEVSATVCVCVCDYHLTLLQWMLASIIDSMLIAELININYTKIFTTMNAIQQLYVINNMIILG